MKRKFLWLEVPEASYEKTIFQLDNPQFLEVANALEKGKLFNKDLIFGAFFSRIKIFRQLSYLLYSFSPDLSNSKIFRALLFRKSHEEVTSALASMTLNQCKELLEEELKLNSDVKYKFIWLEIPEKRFEEAITQVDKENFLGLSKVLEQGTLLSNREAYEFLPISTTLFKFILNLFRSFKQ